MLRPKSASFPHRSTRKDEFSPCRKYHEPTIARPYGPVETVVSSPAAFTATVTSWSQHVQ